MSNKNLVQQLLTGGRQFEEIKIEEMKKEIIELMSYLFEKPSRGFWAYWEGRDFLESGEVGDVYWGVGHGAPHVFASLHFAKKNSIEKCSKPYACELMIARASTSEGFGRIDQSDLDQYEPKEIVRLYEALPGLLERILNAIPELREWIQPILD